MKYLKKFNEAMQDIPGWNHTTNDYDFSDFGITFDFILNYIEELYERGVLHKDVYDEVIQKELPKFNSKEELLDYLYDLGGISPLDYKKEVGMVD